MAKRYTVTNNSGGPRYFHASVGSVTIRPGETSEPLELSDDDRKAIKDRGEFEVKAATEEVEDGKPLGRMNVPELIAEANHRGIAGFTVESGETKPLAELTKAQLVTAIQRHDEEAAKS